MNSKAKFVCISCGKSFPLAATPMNCSAHDPYYGYLYISYDFDTVYGFVEDRRHLWEKYLPLLPVSGLSLHFNETKTPLIHANNLGKKIGIPDLWIKDEGKNPTGSFKDKESIIAINAALEMGLNKVVTVSSGNAAVSTSAYAQKAGINCTCIVPHDLSAGKRFLLGLYSAKVEYRHGSYEELYRNLIDQPDSAWNVTPAYNPYKDEGIKIIGFEIWEELGVPDIIIAPCGNGTLLFGLYKAFVELVKIGKIDKIPTFIGVQIAGGAPLADAFASNKSYAILDSAPDSIAEGIIATESYASPKALHAVRFTGGEIIQVNDTEIKQALKEVITLESIIPEPTAAAVYAGLAKLAPSQKKVVAIQTASGAKNLKEIMESYFK